MNWLIVEDETDIRNLVSMMCQVWGHTPITYESGVKAWEWLDSVEAGTYSGKIPDFALMDIRMPGKRGNEISARIRTIAALKHIPIVLMTAFVMSEEEMEKMRREFGVDAVINKPLPDFDRLKTVLDDIIKKKQADNALSAEALTEQSAPSTAPTPKAPQSAPQSAPSAAPKEEKPVDTPSVFASVSADVTRPIRDTQEAKQVGKANLDNLLESDKREDSSGSIPSTS